MKTAIITLGLISLLLTNIHSKTIDESTTGALLSFPSVVDGPLFNKTWDVAPAQFGYQKYGGTLEGWLIIPGNETYHKECPKCPSNGSITECTTEGPEPLDTNQYIHYIRDWFRSSDDIKDYILVIDRQDCYFVDKIQHAQLMGASGVIMCDWKYEGLFTMWMPQDWSDNIDIPAVLLQRTYCKTLMSHIGVKNWDPTDIASTTYPDPENMNWTIATIEWGLPHPDDRVEYELWTSSNDYLGSKFKHNFNTTAIELDQANDTVFTPHMYILNGSHWGCDHKLPNGTYTYSCKQQCTNQGRYCAVDPEYDMSIGLDGMDVIQENLRSLCVWEYDKENFGNDDVMWWDYAVLWDENCGVYSNSSLNFHADCSWAQMDKLKNNQILSNYVKQCVNTSGGYGYTDGENSILRRETKLKYNQSIYAVPMVRVNEFLIHGNIDCELPVTTSSCEVLSAICAGFIEDKPMPEVCGYTPAPTIETCDDVDRDCNGTCHGGHKYDACGKCLLVSSNEWNECIGCNGVVNRTYDCEGTCGGHYAVNDCGYCYDTRQPTWETYGQDCAGVCQGNKKMDRCGHCIEESNAEWDDCIDCEGNPFGGKEYNACEFCLNPHDPNIDFENYGKDCRGICEGGWTLDKCDVCLSTDNITRDSCVGCDGIPHSGKEFNECGSCVLKTDVNFNDYGKDCRGVCAKSVVDTYYRDDCNQCLLPKSDEWNKCLPQSTNTEIPILREKETELTTVIVIVCIVAFLIIVAACIIIGALWRKQTAINARFDSLAATYVHMDENPQHSFPMSSSPPKQTKKYQETVPDQAESGEDE